MSVVARYSCSYVHTSVFVFQEEVVLKRCWLARYWGLAVQHGNLISYSFTALNLVMNKTNVLLIDEALGHYFIIFILFFSHEQSKIVFRFFYHYPSTPAYLFTLWFSCFG